MTISISRASLTMQSSLCEVVATQSAIISMQSGIINELFDLLSQHIAVEELDNLPVIQKINRAAEIKAGID